MTFQTFKLASAGVLSALLLSACGGGGGGSSAPATVHSDLSYPLSANFQNRIATGATDDFSVSGNCLGNAVITIKPGTTASPTFEGVGIHASEQVSTITLGPCASGLTPTSGTTTGTTYYDVHYTPVGLHIDNNGAYAVFVPPLPTTDLLASVKSGDSGPIVTQKLYTDDTEADQTGVRVLSYAIRDATSTTTVYVDMKTTTYAADGTTLISTETSTYLMADDGSLTFVSLDAQFYAPIAYHLTYTAK